MFKLTVTLTDGDKRRLDDYRRSLATNGAQLRNVTLGKELLLRGLNIAILEQQGDPDLTVEQLGKMTPQESVMRGLLSQAMAYARQGGHVDAEMRLKDQTVAKAYLEGLREAGWMLVPIEADDGTVEALRDSYQGDPATV